MLIFITTYQYLDPRRNMAKVVEYVEHLRETRAKLEELFFIYYE